MTNCKTFYTHIIQRKTGNLPTCSVRNKYEFLTILTSFRITELSPKMAERNSNHDLVRANLEKNKYSTFKRRKPKFKIGKIQYHVQAFLIVCMSIFAL